LKQQQLLKEQERQRILQERIIALPNVDSIEDTGKLSQIYKEMFDRILKLEAEKYDVNYSVRQKDFEINELTIAVNDLRGKFVKPTLKKVSKYDNKFKKMQQEGVKTEKADFRSNLKVVKKENVLEEVMAKGKKSDKPEWSKKGGAEEGETLEKAPKPPKEKAPEADEAEPESVAESVPAEEPAAEPAEEEAAEEEEE